MRQQAEYWGHAVQALSVVDGTLAELMARFPRAQPTNRGNAFETLARAITGQQISVKAADTIWRRLMAITEPVPDAVVALPNDSLRQCGFSAKKVEYLQELARRFCEGSLDESRLINSNDDQAIYILTQVRGIGRWSAEMFLLFHLQRPDVLPLADIGLQRAMRLHYPQLVETDLAGLRQHAEIWRPWRSVATWYLWRSLDPVEVVY